MNSIAILLTCYNRKDLTLKCLSSLFKVDIPENMTLNVYLVDDGSTDGTAIAVKKLYPEITIIKGSGNLFWNRGMLLAWDKAEQIGYDYYLWLNDDTYLFSNAITCLINASNLCNNKAIICGSTLSELTGKISYGGRNKEKLIVPNGKLQKCNLINGNFVLIPKTVYESVGKLDSFFTHALGDHDYGLRAIKKGFDCCIAPDFIGSCENNVEINKCFNSKYPLKIRLRQLYSPLGVNPFIFFKYDYKHFGVLSAAKHFFSIHLLTFFPSIK